MLQSRSFGNVANVVITEHHDEVNQFLRSSEGQLTLAAPRHAHCRPLLLLIAVAGVNAFAADTGPGDAEAGAAKSLALYCSVCHGPQGNSATREWPSLAGQNAKYLGQQLVLLRSRARPNADMAPIAAALSDADIADLAAYYSTQTPLRPANEDSTGRAGETLYLHGDPARAIPSCSDCHGRTGLGDPATGVPALRGQQAFYTSKQLGDYAARTRYSRKTTDVVPEQGAETMATTASRLMPDDIRDLAAFIRRMP